MITKDKVILQINYETHVKDIYIQQEKNAHLSNLPTYLLQYLHILKKKYTNKIQIDEYNRFVSAMCPVYNVIKTQQRCLFEIEHGFMYSCKSMSAKAFCVPCRTSCGCKGGPWRCKEHV